MSQDYITTAKILWRYVWRPHYEQYWLQRWWLVPSRFDGDCLKFLIRTIDFGQIPPLY